LFGIVEAALDVGINFLFVIPIVGEGGINFAESDMGILKM
jgi:hypothetical protein